MKDSSQRTLTRLGLWGLGALAVVGVLYGLMKLGETSPLPVAAGEAGAVVPIASSDHVHGNPQSPVVLVEYSDFECPACEAYYPLVTQVKRDFGEKIAFVYRYFPLQQHQYAEPAAYAAEAAGRQGKFWEYHDKLFDTQRQWTGNSNAPKMFEDYARELGLSVDTFNSDRDSSAVKQRVIQDRDSGLRAGVNSTPSFFLDGKRIQPTTYEQFRQLIEQELFQVKTTATTTP